MCVPARMNKIKRKKNIFSIYLCLLMPHSICIYVHVFFYTVVRYLMYFLVLTFVVIDACRFSIMNARRALRYASWMEVYFFSSFSWFFFFFCLFFIFIIYIAAHCVYDIYKLMFESIHHNTNWSETIKI